MSSPYTLKEAKEHQPCQRCDWHPLFPAYYERFSRASFVSFGAEEEALDMAEREKFLLVSRELFSQLKLLSRRESQEVSVMNPLLQQCEKKRTQIKRGELWLRSWAHFIHAGKPQKHGCLETFFSGPHKQRAFNVHQHPFSFVCHAQKTIWW